MKSQKIVSFSFSDENWHMKEAWDLRAVQPEKRLHRDNEENAKEKKHPLLLRLK